MNRRTFFAMVAALFVPKKRASNPFAWGFRVRADGSEPIRVWTGVETDSQWRKAIEDMAIHREKLMRKYLLNQGDLKSCQPFKT